MKLLVVIAVATVLAVATPVHAQDQWSRHMQMQDMQDQIDELREDQEQAEFNRQQDELDRLSSMPAPAMPLGCYVNDVWASNDLCQGVPYGAHITEHFTVTGPPVSIGHP